MTRPRRLSHGPLPSPPKVRNTIAVPATQRFRQRPDRGGQAPRSATFMAVAKNSDRQCVDADIKARSARQAE